MDPGISVDSYETIQAGGLRCHFRGVVYERVRHLSGRDLCDINPLRARQFLADELVPG